MAEMAKIEFLALKVIILSLVWKANKMEKNRQLESAFGLGQFGLIATEVDLHETKNRPGFYLKTDAVGRFSFAATPHATVTVAGARFTDQRTHGTG
jgi:hypothetical protein